MESLSIKNRILLFVFAVLISVTAVLIGTIYLNQKHKLTQAQNAYSDSLKKSYEKILAKQDQTYLAIAEAIIRTREVQSALDANDRDRLFRLNEDRWNMLCKTDPFLVGMQFHLADGTVLLRMEDPERYGDNARKRPMIARIHKEQKLLHGFEVSSDPLAYRILIPIFYQGEYMGALEFAVRPDIVLSDMEYFSDIEGALFTHESVLGDPNRTRAIGGLTLQYQTLKSQDLLRVMEQRNGPFDRLDDLEHEGRSYDVYSFDLHDFDGKTLGKALFFHDITRLQNEFEETIGNFVVFIGILLIVVMGVINTGFKRIIAVLDRTNAELKQNKEFLQSIFETSKDGIALLDLQTNFLFFNDAYLAMTGFTKEELLTKSCAALSAPEDVPRALEALEKVMKYGFVENFEKTCVVHEGKRVMINMAIALMPDKQHLLITTKNITEAKKLEKELKDYIELVDQNVIISTTDLDGAITGASTAFCAVSGYTKEELIGKNHRILRHPDMDEQFYTDLWETISRDESWEGEVKNRTKEGGFFWSRTRIHPVFDFEGRKTGYAAIREDITSKKIIEELSITDALTGIYNRRHFNEMLPKLINSAKRSGESLNLMILDVDYFKEYNDHYGHLMGDEALIRIAGVIGSSLKRGDDYGFRLGGEEFGVIFKTDDVGSAYGLAEQIREAVISLDIAHVQSHIAPVVTISIGLIHINASAIESKEQLYKQADDLLYRAKENGRNAVVWSAPGEKMAMASEQPLKTDSGRL